jgi:hypothetical protein
MGRKAWPARKKNMQTAGRNNRAAMGFVRERTEVSSFGARSNGNIRPIREMHGTGGKATGVPMALAGKLLYSDPCKAWQPRDGKKIALTREWET